MKLTAVTLVLTLALGLLAAPLGAGAQQAGKIPRVGMLLLATREQTRSFINAFEEGMRVLGYVEGRDIVYGHRFANNNRERLPDLAAEMVRLKVDVIVTGSNEQTAVAKRATTTMPIVMMFSSQPVATGFIASLSKPGGNLTGLTLDVDPEVWGKRLEILKEIVPQLRRVAILEDATVPGRESVRKAMRDAGRTLDVETTLIEVRSPTDFDDAFVAMRRRHVDSLVIGLGALFWLHRSRLVELVAKAELPAIYAYREPVEAGGLISYGTSLPDLSRRAAYYVAKILKGAKPADLPVEQPTKFELIINLKTAKALGLTIPPSVLARADEIIQ